jgi:hypothetical protein
MPNAYGAYQLPPSAGDNPSDAFDDWKPDDDAGGTLSMPMVPSVVGDIQQHNPLLDAPPQQQLAPAPGDGPLPWPPPPGAIRGAAAGFGMRGMGDPESLEQAHMLGLALIAVGAGAYAGARYAGVMGGIAGSLFGGAAVNAIRAARNVAKGNSEADHEAVVSGTFALAGAGLASYILYKAKGDSK